MRHSKKLFLYVLLLFTSHTFSQGRVDGFYKGKGKTEVVLGGGAQLEGNYFAGRDKVGVSRNIFYGNLFVAMGLLDQLDVYLAVPYISINDVMSVQDGSVFVKMKLLERSIGAGNFSLSFAAGYSAPLAPYQTEGLNAIEKKKKMWDFRPVVHYSTDKWFGTFQAAFNPKSDPTPDAMGAALKFGQAGASFYWDAWYEYQYSFGGLDYRGTPTPSTFKQLGVDYHKVGVTAYKPIFERLGAYVAFSYALTGRNIGQGPGFHGGVVLKSGN